MGNPLAVAGIGNASRGPLLLISGAGGPTRARLLTRAVYKQYGGSTAVTDLTQFADRAHLLVMDSGWRFIADYVLGRLDECGVRAPAEES
ncbi:hypothetical protein ACIQZB_40365 [Streptomyces sp. NPDC097727]|uniref:hypothetical protein n=1 Tax=Streptomyces sp. NPDC097727 TaxID=3366092 RepID=UPI003828FF45